MLQEPMFFPLPIDVSFNPGAYEYLNLSPLNLHLLPLMHYLPILEVYHMEIHIKAVFEVGIELGVWRFLESPPDPHLFASRMQPSLAEFLEIQFFNVQMSHGYVSFPLLLGLRSAIPAFLIEVFMEHDIKIFKMENILILHSHFFYLFYFMGHLYFSWKNQFIKISLKDSLLSAMRAF